MTRTPSTPTPSAPTSGKRSWTNRTSLITAAAIVGVLLAGTAAVAANIGMLNAADSSNIGDLAATDQLLPATDREVGSTDGSSATTSTAILSGSDAVATSGDVHQFDIDAAGSVWVVTTKSGLALDHVNAMNGWTPALSQVDPSALRVDFTSGARTIVFTAAVAPDGQMTVDVTEPTTSSASTSGHDDHHDDDHHDDHHEHHEGADDDD